MKKDQNKKYEQKKQQKSFKDREVTYSAEEGKTEVLSQSEMQLKQIGAKLRRIRMERGYTSYESFAWDHDLPRMQYWRMENGKNFTFISLVKILNALDVSLSDFFDEDFNKV